jgi:branched-chain amino acid transport system ATP-binding protein
MSEHPPPPPPPRGAPGNGRGDKEEAVLLVEDMHTFYGSIEALKGISLEVFPGEIVTLIGSNGAGKTTTLRSISGIVPPRTGRIAFQGQEIQGLVGHEVAEIGIAHAPEGRRIFPRMTVRENLEMGAFQREKGSQREDDYERVYTLFPRLKERLNQKGGTLSGGEQQMLAIGRALMARPKVLLLDEPSMGLAPILVEQIFEIVKDINASGTTVLLVEQNALMALGIAKRGYILQTGEIVLQDVADRLMTNPEVQRAYLGG